MNRLILGCIGLSYLVFWSVACKEQPCTSDDECGANSYCIVLDGKCASDCVDDSTCPATDLCKSGKCVKKAESCEPKKNKQCVGARLYWFDSCGYQEELIEDCGKSGCVDDKCTKNDNHCGNGSCEPGLEDCLTCAEDCKCQPGETCDGGVCKAESLCGNGTCDSATEDCASCAKDCGCANGKICKQGQCEDQASCGNGKCEPTEGEECLSCPRDCACEQGKSCNAGTCQDACGDGKCDALANENCGTCAKDCRCQQDQSCVQGLCEKSCGNARCESSYGENCSTCAKDCACASGQPCNDGSCGADCGNGACQADKGENCSTCAKDCACPGGEVCNSGQCSSRCGNGVCDSTQGEDCSTCAKDCACQTGFACASGSCTSPCGDGTCDASKGENCGTCAKDCACKDGKACANGSCSCTPNCTGKSCGDDGCGGTCGSCSGLSTCKNGKCDCAHECPTQGAAKCTGASQYERCDLDPQGCRILKSFTCLAGKPCTNGSCCASACAGKTCGDDGCGGSCGSCPASQACTNGKCACKNACPKEGDTTCDGATGFKECLKDATTGCLAWSARRSCPSGVSCANGSCCQPLCSGKECGSDGCGGNCGTCSYGCTSNLCQRRMIVVSIDFPCGLCDDDGAIFGTSKPDPYLKLTLSTGQSYKTGDKGNTCGSVLTYSWTLDNLSPAALKNAKIEVFDADPVNSDDFCARWQGDFSPPGKRTLTAPTYKNAKVTIEVKR